ncbi:MAG: hypothetical protein KKF65_03690, partial [Nanoarchaeota archaeon]|nr:hypothetical protein [Nanoarchaeota archaeon]
MNNKKLITLSLLCLGIGLSQTNLYANKPIPINHTTKNKTTIAKQKSTIEDNIINYARSTLD